MEEDIGVTAGFGSTVKVMVPTISGDPFMRQPCSLSLLSVQSPLYVSESDTAVRSKASSATPSLLATCNVINKIDGQNNVAHMLPRKRSAKTRNN